MRKRKEGWLADEVHTAPASGNAKCKESFLRNIEEIRNALKTCSVRAIWQTMKRLELYPGGYTGFWKLVQKYGLVLTIPASNAQPEPPTLAHEKPSLTEPEPPQPAVRSTPAWQAHTPQTKKPNLILGAKPMNSNGEQID